MVGGKKIEAHQGTNGDWSDNFFSGASASLCSKVILQPFDTSKTVLQATKELRGGYTNLAQCMVGLVRNRGFGALYTGFLASIAVSAPSSAVFAAGYEFSKTWIEKASQDTALPLLQLAPVLAAAFGNVAASVVRVPPEIIKQRVQAGIYRNVFEATTSVWMKEGVTGFYRGYTAMVARDIPYSALQFMTFEILKRRRLRTRLNSKQQSKPKNGEGMMTDMWMDCGSGCKYFDDSTGRGENQSHDTNLGGKSSLSRTSCHCKADLDRRRPRWFRTRNATESPIQGSGICSVFSLLRSYEKDSVLCETGSANETHQIGESELHSYSPNCRRL